MKLNKNKKGANMYAVGFMLLAIMFVAWALINSGGDTMPGSSTKDVGVPKSEHEIDNIAPSGVTDVELDDSQWRLKVSSDELTVGNKTPVTFDMTSKIKELFRAETGGAITNQLQYKCEAHKFSNQLDSSDTEEYYTVNYVGDDDKYNITVGNTEFATENTHDASVAYGDSTTTSFTMEVNELGVLNKSVEDQYDEHPIASCEVSVDGETAGNVNVVYIKT